MTDGVWAIWSNCDCDIYVIDKLFSSRKKAEVYLKKHKDEFGDSPLIQKEEVF